MSPGPTSVPCHPAASKSLQIVAHIDGPISGTRTLTNLVDVSGQPEHGQNVTANASASVNSQEAKIAVLKTADPTFGSPSTNVTFTLQVENTGNAPLPHVFVSDLLPDGMSYIASSSGSTRVGQHVSWSDIGPMAPGASKSLQIIAQIDGPISGTRALTNLVDVSGKPEHGQNVTANAFASVNAHEANISVSKIANPTFGTPGMIVTFTIAIKNTGSTALSHTFVSDLLPDGMSYVSSSNEGLNNGRYINWSDIGPLAINAEKALSIRAKFDGSAIGQLTNVVKVVSKPDHGQNITSSATADVVAQISGITVDKTADPNEGFKGTIVTFPIKITNNETVKLVHVKAVDVLPPGLDYLSNSTPSPTSAVQIGGRWVLTWNDLGPLNSGQSHNLDLKTLITGAVLGKVTNEINTTGIPEFGDDVLATDTADVFVENAGSKRHKGSLPAGRSTRNRYQLHYLYQ